MKIDGGRYTVHVKSDGKQDLISNINSEVRQTVNKCRHLGDKM